MLAKLTALVAVILLLGATAAVAAPVGPEAQDKTIIVLSTTDPMLPPSLWPASSFREVIVDRIGER